MVILRELFMMVSKGGHSKPSEEEVVQLTGSQLMPGHTT